MRVLVASVLCVVWVGAALAEEQATNQDHTYWRKLDTDIQAGQIRVLGDPMFVFAGKSTASEALMWFTPLCGVNGFNASVAGASDNVVEEIASGVAHKINARFIVAIGMPSFPSATGGIPVIHVDDIAPAIETNADVQKVIGPLTKVVHDAALKQLGCKE